MFALVETWFSSLSFSPLPSVGHTPTRTALAIATCIRGVIDTIMPPPALRQPLQLLFASCICGGEKSLKSSRIRAIVNAGIGNMTDCSALPAGLDTYQVSDLKHALGFLFPTAGEHQHMLQTN